MESLYDVCVFGSCNIDLIAYVTRLPNVGETIHGTKFESGYGGKGANQVVAAARLGSRTAMIGKVGGDHYGLSYIKNLQKENVNTDGVDVLEDATTGMAQISVASNGDNQIIIVTAANNCLSPKDVKIHHHILSSSKVVLFQLETPIPATIKALQVSKGVTILNAAPGLSNIPDELLKLPNIFCVNETEASLVTGLEVNTLEDIKAAVLKLLVMGCQTVIITLGNKGAAFGTQQDQQPAIVKAPIVEVVVDTSGAGDSFLGGLGHLIANYPQLPLYKQIGIACELASLSVRAPGTQKSFPTQKDYDFSNVEKKDFEWNYL